MIGCNVYFLLSNNKWTYPSLSKNIYKNIGTIVDCTDPVAVNQMMEVGIIFLVIIQTLVFNYDSTTALSNGSCVPADFGM